jgi:hypothetical protein
MGLFTTLQKLVSTPIVGIGNVIGKGISAVTGLKRTDVTTEQFLGSTTGKIVSTGIIGTSAALGAIAGGAAITSAGGLGTVAKSLIPKTLVGKAAAVLIAPAAVSAVIQNPLGAASAVGDVADFSLKAGGVISDPSLSGAAQLVKEHPVISGIIAAGAVVAVGKGVAGAVATFGQTQATKEQTKAIEAATAGMGKETTGGLVPEKTLETNTEIPQAQQTTTIQTGKRKRRKAKVAISPSIRQSVSVNVINSSKSVGITNKRYINERILN